MFSCHMLVSVLHMTTRASGRWAMPLRNEGMVAGSTRASRSATSSGSRFAKCVRTGSSACSANSSAARRAAMPASCSRRPKNAPLALGLPETTRSPRLPPQQIKHAGRSRATALLAATSASLSSPRSLSGRPNSRCSAAACVCACVRAQILGVDAMHTKDVRQTHTLLVNHLATIRRIPVFARCKFVLIFESNLAFESQHLLHAVENAGIKNWVSLSEGQQGTLGWLDK